MVADLITIKTGKINDYLYHIDCNAYGTPRMLSVFSAEFDNSSVLIDCGSSLDSKRLIRYIKKLGIDLSSFKYLTTSHHHFDHNGGLWQMYEILKNYNSEVKILTNQKTKELLNDYETHLARGKRTYGDLTGNMKPIEEDAFQVIEPSINFNANPSELEAFDTFTVKDKEVHLGILKTPGHTPDHQCPIFFTDSEIDFIQYGESVGTIYHDSELVTMPTSMPVYYNHKQYMSTLNNLKIIYPMKAGFGHFGVVNGKENVRQILLENESSMEEFRAKIIMYYNEKPETRYVVEKMMPFLTPKTDLTVEHNPVLKDIALAIVYGMMMDLGYRES